MTGNNILLADKPNLVEDASLLVYNAVSLDTSIPMF
jgi:hypothetical protein